MKISEQFPSRFIKGQDLRGREVTVSIKGLYKDRIGPEEKEELIISFNESPREMVLNRTNATTVAELHGDETDNWKGKKITLYPTKVQAFGKTHEVIRIKAVKAGPAKPDDDNPFADIEEFNDDDMF